MSTEQHEALTRADLLVYAACVSDGGRQAIDSDFRREAADTIRTQHALIVQMAEALEAIAKDMTVGDRWTNAGQYLLDAHAATTQYLTRGPKT